MSARTRRNKNKSPPFLRLRHDILESSAYLCLSWPARCLLVEIARQYKGRNNGDLTAAYSVMKPRGFASKGTLDRALRELLAAGLIEQTRQGGRNRCSLYAITWEAIDDCRDRSGASKLDVASTTTPSNAWRQPGAKKSVPRMRVIVTPPKGQSGRAGQKMTNDYPSRRAVH